MMLLYEALNLAVNCKAAAGGIVVWEYTFITCHFYILLSNQKPKKHGKQTSYFRSRKGHPTVN